MPRISIVERDETGAGVYAESTDVVYIPGFVDTLQKSLYNNEGEYVGIEVNVPTLFTSVAQFESLCGTKGATFDKVQSYMDLRADGDGFGKYAVPYHKVMFNKDDIDPSYIMAKEYLASGINVLYERVNADPSAVKYTPDVISYVENEGDDRQFKAEKPAKWEDNYTSYLMNDKSYQEVTDAIPPAVWKIIPVNTSFSDLSSVYGIPSMEWDSTNYILVNGGKDSVTYKYATEFETDDDGNAIIERPIAFSSDYYENCTCHSNLRGYAQGASWAVKDFVLDSSSFSADGSVLQVKLGNLLTGVDAYDITKKASEKMKQYTCIHEAKLYKGTEECDWASYFGDNQWVFDSGDKRWKINILKAIQTDTFSLKIKLGYINNVTTKPLYVLDKPYYKMEYTVVTSENLSKILDNTGIPVKLSTSENVWVEGVFYSRKYNSEIEKYEYILVEDDKDITINDAFTPIGYYYKEYTEITRDATGDFKALPTDWYANGFVNYFEKSNGSPIHIPARSRDADKLWSRMITVVPETANTSLPYKVTKNDLYVLDAGINIVNMYNALGGVYDCGKSDGLIDKGNYSFKYLTSGGYPVYEYNKGDIVAKMIALATERGDCVAIIDHTDNTYREKDINREGSLYKAVAEDSSLYANGDFATMFTPWAEYVRTTTDKRINDMGNKVIETPKATRLPGSFAYLMALADSIRTNANWLAIAGSSRGVVLNLATDGMTTMIPNGVADEMQPRDKVAVNAITNIKPYGWTIWGNRTLKNNGEKGNLTATSFLNVRNLISDVKKLVYKVSRQLTFEQNNDILWINFKSLITPTLERMISGYGISGYKILKNTTHEKAAEKATLCVDIILYPVYPVEDFYITVILKDDEVTVE